jgi:hypothetical protein
MVSMLAIGPKVHGFKPDGFLRAIIRSTPSFGGEIKPLAPCMFLRHAKITSKYERRYFEG